MNKDLKTFSIETSFGTCNIQAKLALLMDPHGEERISLTGRLTNPDGHVVAIGTIHEYIIPAFENMMPSIGDWATAHGCNNKGHHILYDYYGDVTEKSEAWFRASKMLDNLLKSQHERLSLPLS